MRKLVILLTLVAVAAVPSFAGNILYYIDYSSGSNVIPAAITAAGYTGVGTNDPNAFATDIAAGGWSMIIVAEQDYCCNYSIFGPALASWIAGGGRVIGATWQDGGVDNLLQGSVASSNGLTITNTGGALFAGITGDIALYNPGWGIYSQYYNTLAGGTCLSTLAGYGCGIVLGNGGKTLLNAPLFDTYSDYPTGVRFVENEIGYLNTPEPGTLTLLGSGVLGIAGVLRRKFNI